MTYRHGRHNIVIILESGESQSPERLVCINKFCKRTMMKVNRDVAAIIENNRGIHWADVPEDVTVLEHKCRGCDNYYKIYTPQTVKAQARIEEHYDV